MPSFQEPIDIGIVSRKKVLVAEDEANIAALIDDWLSDVYEVTVASNGKAALQKAKWTNPDIILMDVVMPDMGGYEVIRALLSDTATNRIPIIAMSAQNFDDSTIKLIKGEINVMGFINKPFKPDVLKSTIEHVLAGERMLNVATPSAGGSPVPAREAETPLPEPPVPDFPAPVPAMEMPPPRQVPARPAVSVSSTAPPVPAPHLSSEPVSDETTVSWFWVFVKFGFKIFFLVALLAATGEVACRLTEDAFDLDFTAPPVRVTRGIDGPAFEFVPGTVWEHDGVSHRFNSWGLREGDIPLTRSTDTYRLFLLGGSDVFGAGVPFEQTAARVMERLLNERTVKPYARYEVINGGFWGFSLKDQWAAYKRLAPALEPDALVWVMAEERSPAGLWIPEGVPAEAALILRKSRFLSLMFHRHRVSRRGSDASARLMDAARRETQANGTSFLAVPMPSPSAGNVPPLAEEGVRRLSWEEKRRFAPENRLPAAGHRWLAEELAEMLIESEAVRTDRS